MAQVFLAIDPRRTGVHRLVALKTLRDRVADSADHLEMFHDEARIASLIQHPNVCQVMDFGFARGRPFLAMEFVCGENLRSIHDRFAQGGVDADTLPPTVRIQRLATIVAEAARGLHATHELRAADGESLGAVHRDVTPDNILVSCGGTVKVVDFGVVKAMDSQHQTEAGIIKGKMAYVAPENLKGRPVDRRADVFALGVILWELLAGERLYRRDNDVQTLEALMNTQVRPPSEVRADVPPIFDELVLQALSHEPEERPQTARDFAARLTRSASEAGLAPDVFELEAFVHDHFDHDAACLQRGLQEAQSLRPSELLDPWLESTSEPPPVESTQTPAPPTVSSSWTPTIPPPPTVPSLPSIPPGPTSVPTLSATPPPVWSTITSSHVVLPAAMIPPPAAPEESRMSWLTVAAVTMASAVLATLLTGFIRDAAPPSQGVSPRAQGVVAAPPAAVPTTSSAPSVPSAALAAPAAAAVATAASEAPRDDDGCSPESPLASSPLTCSTEPPDEAVAPMSPSPTPLSQEHRASSRVP